MSKSTLTRRALVASTAAMPAAAALSLPVAALADPTGADAELVKLGAELAALDAEWFALRIDNDEEDAILDAKIKAATGISEDEAPPNTYENRKHWYWVTYKKIVNEFPHKDPDLERWSDFSDRLRPLVDKIMEQKATTLAGLAVQTHATIMANHDLWADQDHDQHGETLRQLFESLCSFLNIKPSQLRYDALTRVS